MTSTAACRYIKTFGSWINGPHCFCKHDGYNRPTLWMTPPPCTSTAPTRCCSAAPASGVLLLLLPPPSLLLPPLLLLRLCGSCDCALCCLGWA